MPTNLTLKLSTVALEYLLNHDELETARDLFQGERRKLLDELGEIMQGEARAKKQRVTHAGRDDKSGFFDLDIDGLYATVRAKSGDKRTSGYSIVIGSYFGHVGAQTLVWFQFKLTPTRQESLDIAGLQHSLGTDVSIFGEGRWTYIRIASHPPSALDLTLIENDVRQLPGIFAAADAWISQHWLARTVDNDS